MRLLLHRVTIDNRGRLVDAGVVIDVGGGEDQVAEDRALELLEQNGAVDLDAPVEPVQPGPSVDVLDLEADQLAHELGIEQPGA